MKKLNERVIQNRNYLRNSSNKTAIYEGFYKIWLTIVLNTNNSEYCRNGVENPSAQVDLSFLYQKGVVFESSSNSSTPKAFANKIYLFYT